MPRRRMVSPQKVTWDKEGQSLKGTLTAKEDASYAGRPRGKYTVENDTGKYILLGTQGLDDTFAAIEEGTMVEVVYKGTEGTQGGTTFKVFEVYVIDMEDNDGEE